MIAREAIPYLVVTTAVAVAASLVLEWPWGLAVWPVVAVLALIGREPRRRVPASPLGLVSPADGTVMAVAHASDPVLQRAAHRIDVGLRRWGPYVLRSPTEGKVILWRAERDANGRWTGLFHVRTDEGEDVVVVVKPRTGFSGLLRSRIRQSERAGQGQPFAYMAFGLRVTLYCAATARPQVAPGDRVRAGSDILALLANS